MPLRCGVCFKHPPCGGWGLDSGPERRGAQSAKEDLLPSPGFDVKHGQV